MIRTAFILILTPIALAGCASTGDTAISRGFSDNSQTYVYRSGTFAPASTSAYGDYEADQASSNWSATATPAPNASTSEYVYRGGRDPKTGRADTSL